MDQLNYVAEVHAWDPTLYSQSDPRNASCVVLEGEPSRSKKLVISVRTIKSPVSQWRCHASSHSGICGLLVCGGVTNSARTDTFRKE